MKNTPSIEFDSALSKFVKRMLTLLIVVATILFIYGLSVSITAGEEREIQNKATEAVENIDFAVTNKANMEAYSSRVEFDFTVLIKNNGDYAVNYVEGTFTIKNKAGNVLSYGTAYFGTTMNTTELGYKFPKGVEQTYTLSWDDANTEEVAEIWNSEISDLEFSFDITRIKVENDNIVDLIPNT